MRIGGYFGNYICFAGNIWSPELSWYTIHGVFEEQRKPMMQFCCYLKSLVAGFLVLVYDQDIL